MAFDPKFDLRLYENRNQRPQPFSGLLEHDFRVLEGSRLVLSIRVLSISGTLNVDVGNDFEADGTFNALETFDPITSVGTYKKIITDFHSLFKIKLDVGGGSCEVKIAVTSNDNATNEITLENAEIEVGLDASDDSVTAIVKDEDGDALEINPDGSINVDGVATEATLAQILAAVDQLESYTDGIEALIAAGNTLLAAIDSNTDQLESYVDQLESLVTATNALLTTIRDNADDVETLLTAIAADTGSLVGLVGTTNSLLTQIRDNADTVETLLTNIGNNTDGLEALATTTNSLLTQIRDNADTVETLLSNISQELNSAHYTMNEAFDKATAIAGQLDDVGTTVATEDNVAPVRITSQRALHANLRNSAGDELQTTLRELHIRNAFNVSGVQGSVSVTTTATPIRVGVANLTNRKSLTAHNNGNATIYWGYTNAVTPATGTPFSKDQFASWALGPDVTVFMIASAGSHDVRVTEVS